MRWCVLAELLIVGVLGLGNNESVILSVSISKVEIVLLWLNIICFSTSKQAINRISKKETNV